ncbi:FecR domain-containing protein [Nitrincola alkalilacustris]|uniref:FecR domain-containing protein n=1 Tax=Nitrincola alkalilacustris TaxID=1571224 RepID=UPI001456A3D9|nr:FecR domain-containing protein [Nitrincola alkalilacustris]
MTSAGARAQLVLGDNTVISLGGNAEFRVDEFINTDDDARMSLNIAQGTFKAISGQIVNRSPESFRLNSRTATVGIRGTIITGKITPEFELFATIRGNIFVIENVTGAQVDVPAGQFTRVIAGFPPTPAADLTQDIVNELATDVEVPPPSAGRMLESSGSVEPAQMVMLSAVATEQEVLEYAGRLDDAMPSRDLRRELAGDSLSDQAIADRSEQAAVDQINESHDGPLTPPQNPDEPPPSHDQPGTIIDEPELTDAEQLERYLWWWYSFYSSEFANVTFVPPVTQLPGASDHYSVWGSWTGGVWVAGSRTPETVNHINSLLGTSTIYNYFGQARGHVYMNSFSAAPYDILLDSVNQTQLSFNFGTGVYSGSIRFHTSGGSGTLWDISLSNGVVTENGVFTFNARENVLNTEGGLIGNFYGPAAESLGGFFNLVNSAQERQAVGVIRAVR